MNFSLEMNSGNLSAGFPCRAPPFSRNSVSPFVWEGFSELEDARWAIVVVEAIFLIVGVLWNLFILSCYLRTPKLLGEPANMYLLNLAIVDILISIFVTLTSLISAAAGEFVFGSNDFSRCIYCKFLGAVMHILISQSLHTLSVLSVDRCMLFACPIRYKSFFTWKKAFAIIISLWLVSVAISIPPLFGFGDYEYNLAFVFCNARWTGETSGTENIYYILFFGLETMIPITVLLVVNIWIIKIVKGALKKRITRQRSFRDTRSHAKNEEMVYQKQQKQLMKVFGALFVAHVVCWFPVLTVLFVALGVGADSIPPEVFIACWLAFLTNPVVHPILETFFVQDLRYRVNKTRESVNTSLKKAHGTLQNQLSSSSLFKGLSSRPSAVSLNIPMTPRVEDVHQRHFDTPGVRANGKLGESPLTNSHRPLKSRISNVSFKLSNDKDSSAAGHKNPSALELNAEETKGKSCRTETVKSEVHIPQITP